MEDDDLDWSPHYNIAPTQSVPAIRQHPREPRRTLSLMRWGLVPYWAKDATTAFKMINARTETAAETPAFREPLRKRRCLIPADGFYEWKKTGKSKQPYCFTVGDGELFAFAGIWDRWKNPAGEVLETFSILTSEPNRLCREVHDRMPVILPPESYDLWLDPGLNDAAAVSQLLKPFDANVMRSFPVSTRVNNVANDDAACGEEAIPATGSLF